MIEDYKAQAPTHVLNIKVIAGSGNREFMAKLVASYNEMTKFIRVMRNFTIIRTQAVAAARSASALQTEAGKAGSE